MMKSADIFEKLFYQALRIRLIEEKIVEVYPVDKVESPVHLSIGQEHHIVSFMQAVEKKDIVFTTYRSHAIYLAKGGDLKLMMAELYGKYDGISKGKAGSMHLCSPENGMMGSSAIVGAVFSHALGMAYAQKIDKHNTNITICVTGEGATEEGVFCETLNFASLKKLPIVYVIENNGLAINIPLELRQSYNLRKLAEAYDIDYIYYENGMKMVDIYNHFSDLVLDIKQNPRPVIVEVNTYRYLEHVGIGMDYDKGYRTIDEYEKWAKIDPLINDKALIEKFSDSINLEIAEAVKFAEDSSYPSKSELLKDVY